MLITKRGRPCAKLIAVGPEKNIFDCLRGVM